MRAIPYLIHPTSTRIDPTGIAPTCSCAWLTKLLSHSESQKEPEPGSIEIEGERGALRLRQWTLNEACMFAVGTRGHVGIGGRDDVYLGVLASAAGICPFQVAFAPESPMR
jgi:hypothetical protein